MSRPAVVPSSTKATTFALVGNPNSGKTTLFNALTGLRQKVGNYPGVTVEKKTGDFYSLHGERMEIIDLPGAYSLSPRSPDEAIARDVLFGRLTSMPRPDRVVCVVDASNLDRHLFLISQVLDLGLPTIIALNMVDLASAKGLTIDVAALSGELGVPVVRCQANTKSGVTELRRAMSQSDLAIPVRRWRLPAPLAAAVNDLGACLGEEGRANHTQVSLEAQLFLAGEKPWNDATISAKCQQLLQSWHERFKSAGIDFQEAAIAARYEHIQGVCERVIRAGGDRKGDWSDRFDSVLTHPIWGWVCFFGLMGLMFFSIFSLAGYPMDWIDSAFRALSDGVRRHMAPGDLRNLITDGAIGGVGSVIMFLPQILILFFFIGLLEDTGYMARAAFIMDRVMSRVGLHGKSFIPLLSSYACAIPGIMATRTIENPKDRLVTILVAPLMSCSARLPVYTLMMATLLSAQVHATQKAGLLMVFYLFGTGVAFFFAWLFKKTLMRGETPVLIMELPPYRRPSLSAVALQMLNRSKYFVKRAGTVILGLSILLWFLAAYPNVGEVPPSTQLAQSYAGRIGHALEPLIEPLGFDWKIGIGLVGSFAAREVFVSTMSIVYNVQSGDDVTTPLSMTMLQERWPDGRPVFTPLVCVSLIVFYVLAMQCISTIAVVRRETNSWRWPLFQLAYMTGAAYVASLLVYQGGKLLGLQ